MTTRDEMGEAVAAILDADANEHLGFVPCVDGEHSEMNPCPICGAAL